MEFKPPMGKVLLRAFQPTKMPDASDPAIVRADAPTEYGTFTIVATSGPSFDFSEGSVVLVNVTTAQPIMLDENEFTLADVKAIAAVIL
jgi:hypothetical protein